MLNFCEVEASSIFPLVFDLLVRFVRINIWYFLHLNWNGVAVHGYFLTGVGVELGCIFISSLQLPLPRMVQITHLNLMTPSVTFRKRGQVPFI